jgi:cytochrome b involved in lipid metabolism
MAEVQRHTKAGDLWMVIDSRVYVAAWPCMHSRGGSRSLSGPLRASSLPLFTPLPSPSAPRYDLSKFAAGQHGGHPGGKEILVAMAGADGTSEFEFIGHSPFARKLLSAYAIGVLDSASEEKLMAVKENTQVGRLRDILVPVVE